MSRVLLHSIVFEPDGVSTAYLMTQLGVELGRLGHVVTVLTTTPHNNFDGHAEFTRGLERKWGGLVYYGEQDGMPTWRVKLPLKGDRVLSRAWDFVRFHLVSILLALRSIGRQDIVIATSPPLTMGVMSWLLAWRWGGAAVYRVAEIYPDLAIEQGVVKGRAVITLLNRIEQLVYRRNDRIVPIANQFEQTIRARGVPADKLTTIPDFVDLDFYKPVPRDTELESALALPAGFRVLYAGNIGVFQDWEGVLQAAAALADRPISFVIVGGGARCTWVAEEIERRELRNITLLPYQPKETIPRLTALCDVMLIPMTASGARGGFPSKIFTILASAKPVIVAASADSEMAQMVHDSGCGLVVEPESGPALKAAIIDLWRRREQLATMGARGREFVAPYSKPEIAKRYDVLILELLDSGRTHN